MMKSTCSRHLSEVYLAFKDMGNIKSNKLSKGQLQAEALTIKVEIKIKAVKADGIKGQVLEMQTNKNQSRAVESCN